MVTTQQNPDVIRDLVLNAHSNFTRVQELVEGNPSLLTVSAPWDETPLQAASHMGNRQIAEWLLGRGAPLDVFAAAMLGRQDDVAAFLDENPDLVHARGVHGMPILYFPAASGRTETAAFLLERGADINEGAGKNTALHAAAQMNQPEMARWLLDHGADPTTLDYENKTPLMVAEEKGRTQVAMVLTAPGAAG